MLLRWTYRDGAGEVLKTECVDIALRDNTLIFRNYERGNSERTLLEFTLSVSDTPWFLKEDRLKSLIKKSGVAGTMRIIEEVALYLFKL